MKLLLFPLAIMVVISFLSVSGLGDGNFNGEHPIYYNYNAYGGGGNSTFLYDEGGHAVCDYDLKPVGEIGEPVPYHRAGAYLDLAMWHNETGDFWMFNSASEASPDTAVTFDSLVAGWSIMDQSDYDDETNTRTFSVAGSFGVLALIGGIMALGSFIGIRFFGMGESETSIKLLLICTFFTSIWMLFTALTYTIFFSSGNGILNLIYFALSLMYSVGMILTMSGGIDD